MEGYLGETFINVEETEFRNHTPSDWVMYFIEMYGQIDGDHHKLWLLDQIAQILKGTKVIIKLAKWKNGHKEYRVYLASPSKEYHNWVREMNKDGYSYDRGIAP